LRSQFCATQKLQSKKYFALRSQFFATLKLQSKLKICQLTDKKKLKEVQPSNGHLPVKRTRQNCILKQVDKVSLQLNKYYDFLAQATSLYAYQVSGVPNEL
jgi:hypothetical protein